MTRKTTLVDELVSRLCTEIFTGIHRVDDALPPIRELAKRYETTVPTMQRVIARLEEMGLLSVRQGSGMRVLDPRLHANQAVLPHWLEALVGHPKEARALLADFLELRTTLASGLLAKVASKVGTSEFASVHTAVDEFEKSVEAGASMDEIITRDLAVVRALLLLAPQVAISTVFNGFETLIRTSPALQQALYAEPETNIAGWRFTFEMLSESDFLSTIGPLIAAIDQDTLDRFENALEMS